MPSRRMWTLLLKSQVFKTKRVTESYILGSLPGQGAQGLGEGPWHPLSSSPWASQLPTPPQLSHTAPLGGRGYFFPDERPGAPSWSGAQQECRQTKPRLFST